jgi:hypothetical protein
MKTIKVNRKKRNCPMADEYNLVVLGGSCSECGFAIWNTPFTTPSKKSKAATKRPPGKAEATAKKFKAQLKTIERQIVSKWIKKVKAEA